jgi:hypothetical protein
MALFVRPRLLLGRTLAAEDVNEHVVGQVVAVVGRWPSGGAYQLVATRRTRGEREVFCVDGK